MQAYHKKEKAKAIKKGKSLTQKHRTEKLARRNPDRIQKQISELKALESSGQLSGHDRKTLGELEKELAAVKKAREAVGAPVSGFSGPRGDGGARRPRGRGQGQGQSDENPDDSDTNSTSSSVADIPLPPGTPPPLIHKFPRGPRQPHALPPKPVVAPVQTTYEAAPIVRDLRKEAAAFVPAVVKRKLEAEKATKQGEQAIKEEEAAGAEDEEGEGVGVAGALATGRMVVNAAPDVDEEMTRFQVEMEDAEDEEG
ncbi:hypothetical protein RUND412_004851 [Rhizina undulata]